MMATVQRALELDWPRPTPRPSGSFRRRAAPSATARAERRQRASRHGRLHPGGRAESSFRVVPLVPSVLKMPVRTVTYCSTKKGKRKTVKAVIDRFLRLHSGLWLRRKAGYKKKLWKKTSARKRRLREMVFCNKTQSKMLDKMTTSFWRRRNWYVDDPYQKYHDRTNLKV
ncbi:large ribosomal subunit protein bL35m isoform 2-T2 [Thomomys bottae]